MFATNGATLIDLHDLVDARALADLRALVDVHTLVDARALGDVRALVSFSFPSRIATHPTLNGDYMNSP
jgi:hypothetical protein